MVESKTFVDFSLVTLAFDNKTGVTIVRYPKREAVIFKVFLFELVRRGNDDVKHQLGSAQNVSSRSTKIRGGPDWSI